MRLLGTQAGRIFFHSDTSDTLRRGPKRSSGGFPTWGG